ncbi:MAG: hypothetical protein NC084_03340 [Bacteroides sp.]|nr:hypothetical protein [Eubacterium sp.]MCM1417558.1 hypothetical protein [Roseburia sp.]MCM1461731.1 hypothetical protein [Bacteroides sp.]
MILGSFLNALSIPVIPYLFIGIAIVVQLAGFAFLIYRMKATKSMDAVNTAQLDKITHIVGLVFIIYVAIELIGAFACVTANEICRGLYHYPAGSACVFCNGLGGHTGASDILMLGIYFDAFIVNSYVIAAVNTVKDFFAKKKIHIL